MKKTLLFINGHLDAGGCERSLIDVLKNIDYEKYDVDLLLLEHKGDYYDEVPKQVNISLCSLNFAFGALVPCIMQAIKRRDWFSLFFRFYYTLGNKINRRFLGRLKKYFEDLKDSYDIIIAYRPGICTELAAFTFQGGKKISWWHHGCMNFAEKAAEVLELSYQQMDYIVAVSLSSAKLIAEAFPNVENKIKIISNMIIPAELHNKSNKFVPEEFQKVEFKIISVGRMSPEKNMTLCPQIAECLKKMGISFKWILVGDGVEEQAVATMIRRLNLQEEVVMVGRKSNPYPYISAADLMVHPSLVESQGITLLESMVLGTPVIAVDSEGPEEFIKTGENGYLVKNNVEEITQIIEMLYFNPQLCSIIADNAANDVRRFGVEEIMKKIKKILEG